MRLSQLQSLLHKMLLPKIRAEKRAPNKLGFEILESRRLLASTVEIVKDIETAAEFSGSSPDRFKIVGSNLFFTATTAAQGTELWKTDGTDAGTSLVKDIYTGVASSEIGESFNPTSKFLMAEHLGKLYFGATSESGKELWVSDGTEAGTVQLKDIASGAASSNPSSLTSVGQNLYFLAVDELRQGALYKTDGTTGGTIKVKNFPVDPIFAYFKITNLVAFGDTLYFLAPTDNGYGLWKSDGTEVGTVVVKELAVAFPNANFPQSLTVIGSNLYFAAENGSFLRNDLWKSDGSSEGTIPLTSGGLNPFQLTKVGQTLFFVGSTEQKGSELYKSNGTATGTVLVKDIRPGPLGSTIETITDVNGMALLVANDGINGKELWRSSGTSAGTFLVRNINPNNLPDVPGPSGFSVSGNTLYFRADDGIRGTELWKSGGTAATTVLVKEFQPGISSGLITSIIAHRGFAFFGASTPSMGVELWKSNGTNAGTTLVKDIRVGTSDGVDIKVKPVQFNGYLYFVGNTATQGLELWRSDGTATGTMIVREIVPGIGSPAIQDFIVSGNYLYFTALTSTNGRELWRTDGTESGTIMLRDILPGSLSSGVSELTDVSGTLYFVANDGTSGKELWKSSGTEAGTVLVKDIFPGQSGSSPSSLTNNNGVLYFAADDIVAGRELFKSNGTIAGTSVVADINTSGSSNPSDLTLVGTTLFFVAYTSAGSELWKRSVAGTTMVKDILIGAGSSWPSQLTKVGNWLYFTAETPSTGRELWRTAGTSASTTLVADIVPGPESSTLRELTALNGSLYFVVQTNDKGRELWRSSGSAATTAILKDLVPGEGSSNPLGLTVIGNLLYFSATTNGTRSVWSSNGTSSGTLRVVNSANNAPAPEGKWFVKVGTRILFVGASNFVGVELFSIQTS